MILPVYIMVPSTEFLRILKPRDGSRITSIIIVRHAHIVVEEVTQFILHNVLYIPRFNFNLISVSQLAIKYDCSIRFIEQMCEIQKNHIMRMIGFAKMHHGLYVFENPKGPGKHFSLYSISINSVSINKLDD